MVKLKYMSAHIKTIHYINCVEPTSNITLHDNKYKTPEIYREQHNLTVCTTQIMIFLYH